MSIYSSYSDWLTALGGTYSRASNASYYNSSGTLSTASTNALRFDYDPVTHAAKGILLEGARTNLATYSQQIQNAIGAWASNGSITITPNTTDVLAPDGTHTATKIVVAGAGVNEGVYLGIGSGAGTTQVFGIYLIGASGGEEIQIGDASSRVTKTISQSWDRYENPAHSILSPNHVIYAKNNTAMTFYAWGAQLETAAFLSSYIPTTSSSATRAADILTFPTSPWFNASAGTFFVEVDAFTSNQGPTFINDSGSNLYLYAYDAAGTVLGSYNGADLLSKSSAINKAVISKAIIAFDGTGRSITGGGLSVATDAHTPSAVTSPFQLSPSAFVHIRKVGYWPFRVTNSELQRLTT